MHEAGALVEHETRTSAQLTRTHSFGLDHGCLDAHVQSPSRVSVYGQPLRCSYFQRSVFAPHVQTQSVG